MSELDQSSDSWETIETDLSTSDRMTLKLWSTRPAEIKAVVVLTHGIGEHSGRYQHVIRSLVQAGYAFVRYDLRGHGLSGGRRGDAASYEKFMDDLTEVLNDTAERFPDTPIILYGHSLGGNIVANYVLDYYYDDWPVIGAMLTSPWFRLVEHPSAFKQGFLKGMALIWPRFSIPAKFRPSKLARSEEAKAAYLADPLVHQRLSVKVAAQAFDYGFRALEKASSFPIPTLCIHGSADRVTDPIATEMFSKAAPDSTLALFADLVHETHNEPEWQDVVRTMINWCDQLVQAHQQLLSHTSKDTSEVSPPSKNEH